jgi:hypothetical protein
VIGRRAARLALLALLALARPAAAASDQPLGVGTPGTFRWLFLDMPLTDARGAGGAVRVDLRWWLSSDWSEPTQLVRGGRTVRVREDVQSDVLQAAVVIPWGRLGAPAPLARVETTAELRLAMRWGGWTDEPISRWHGLVGAWNYHRNKFPADVIDVQLGEVGGRTLVRLRHGQAALSDLALRTQVPLLEGSPGPGAGGAPAWAVALRADVKLPTGRLALAGGSGGVDAGLGLLATHSPAPWLTFHAMGAARLVSPLPHRFPLQPSPLQWGLDASVVVRPHRAVALVLEDRLSSPLFGGAWRLTPGYDEPEATAYYALLRPQNQISGGLRLGEVTAFLSEDFTPWRRISGDPGPNWFFNSNAPDLVLGLSWARSY